VKTAIARMGAWSLVLVVTSSALAQDEGYVEAPPPDEESSPSTEEPAPEPDQSYAQGEWVYSDQYGWIWVPAGTVPVAVNAQPYVYVYAPAYGWTWFASPWGWEPFVVGPQFAFRHHFRRFSPRFGARFGPRFVGPRRVPNRGFVGPRFVAPPARRVSPGVRGAPPPHVTGGMHGGRR
jgi:hypothetical protein